LLLRFLRGSGGQNQGKIISSLIMCKVVALFFVNVLQYGFYMFAGAKLVGFKIVAGTIVQVIVIAPQGYFIIVFSAAVKYIVIAVNKAIANVFNFKYRTFRYLFAKSCLPFAYG
jgi:hypothetical protein